MINDTIFICFFIGVKLIVFLDTYRKNPMFFAQFFISNPQPREINECSRLINCILPTYLFTNP